MIRSLMEAFILFCCFVALAIYAQRRVSEYRRKDIEQMEQFRRALEEARRVAKQIREERELAKRSEQEGN